MQSTDIGNLVLSRRPGETIEVTTPAGKLTITLAGRRAW